MTRSGISKYILDASAWIEYFRGSDLGKQVRDILEKKNARILVPDTTVAEVFWWTLREGIVFGPLLECMRAHASFVELNTNFWVEASHYKARMRSEGRRGFGTMDAILLAVQKPSRATIVTSDMHFKGLRNVLLLSNP